MHERDEGRFFVAGQAERFDLRVGARVAEAAAIVVIDDVLERGGEPSCM